MSDREQTAGDDPGGLDPADAFGLLAHDTRIAVLRALWTADRPLRYSEITDRAGIPDTGNPSYHIRELVGPFVREEGDLYSLTHAGRQAMTAVLTGDLTDRTAFDPTRVDRPCPYCGADVALAHYGDKLRVVCTACEGTFQDERLEQSPDGTALTGTITALPFPAAGVRDRDPVSVLDAGLTRLCSRWRDATNGVCPDCGGTTTSTVAVCPDHDPDGVCGACGSRFAGTRTVTCDNCGQRHDGDFPLNAVSDPASVAWFRDRGVDLLDPTWNAAVVLLDCEERIRAVDPLDATVGWTMDGDRITLHVGEGGRAVRVDGVGPA